MNEYKCINAEDALSLIQDGAAVVDIRDEQSFQHAHIVGAYNLRNDNIHLYMAEADFDTPLVVCCYHGISSQSAAQYLISQGFDTVYSLDGGFEHWHFSQPDHCQTGDEK